MASNRYAQTKRQLARLEQIYHPYRDYNADDLEEEEQRPVTLSEIYTLFIDGNLKFTGPGQVAVGGFIGKSTPDYEWLSAEAAWLNGWFVAHPCVVVPITEAQCHLALDALSQGQFLISEIWNGDRSRIAWKTVFPIWHVQRYKPGDPRDRDRLAKIVDRAIDCLAVQVPERTFVKTLEFVGELLHWCLTEYEREDEP